MRRLGRTFRKGLLLGAVIGIVYAVVRVLRPSAPGDDGPGRSSFDARPAPAARPEPSEAAWAAAPRVVPEPVTARSPGPVPVEDEVPGADPVPTEKASMVVGQVTKKRAAKKAPAKKVAAKKVAAKKRAARKQAAKKQAARKRTTPLVAADRRAPTWVDPDGRTCPPSHPVKANTASGIFHRPGGAAYERTAPDRCYPSAEAAEADGHRAAKR